MAGYDLWLVLLFAGWISLRLKELLRPHSLMQRVKGIVHKGCKLPGQN